RRLRLVVLVLLLPILVALVVVLRSREPLPADLAGGLVFVSNRDGVDALYWRRLPKDRERRLTSLGEPVREPAISPRGAEVAFAGGGRIGLAPVARGEVRMLTLGVEWPDSAPAWRPDGKGLVITARRTSGLGSGLHVLNMKPIGEVERHPLTQSRGL